MEIDLVGIKLKNPVMVASGTFGWGHEYSEYLDLNKLGAIITKTITLMPREGNPPPRVVETASGMLNSIGLQNKGVDDFIDDRLPFLAKFDIPVIANIAGESAAEYAELVKKLDGHPQIKGIELNISCPNVKHGGMYFCFDPKLTEEVVKACRKHTKLPLIAKLSPNVTDIALIAKAAENAGADAVSLINTLLGMSIDIEQRTSKLGTMTGGLSGPAIKPIALRCIWQVYKAVKIPIIGIGGIMSGKDAIEFFLAGATAIQVGTANFVDTQASLRILDEINDFLTANNIKHYSELIGKLN